MKDIKHARLMLDMAEADVRAIMNMTDSDKFTDSVFGFHCQQAVEKLCKAWLSAEGVEYPRTHDLRTLMQFIEQHRLATPDVRERKQRVAKAAGRQAASSIRGFPRG